MSGRSLNLAILNFVGGICVISSYLYGAMSKDVGGIWGGIPDEWRSLYTMSMIAAAAGYFPFTFFFMNSIDLERGSFAGDRGYGAIAASYSLILFPSSLWLPLTIRMLQSPSPTIWWLIRLDLFLVALGSIGLAIAAATYDPVRSRVMRAAALIGLAFFCLQTVVLDALVWPALFPG